MIEEIEKEVRTDLSIHIANLNWLIQDLQNASLDLRLDNKSDIKHQIRFAIGDTKNIQNIIKHLNLKINATD